MSVNLKNTAAAAGLAVASAFSANASAFNAPSFDQGSIDVIQECIAEAPGAPQECIRAEMVEIVSEKIKALEAFAASQGPVPSEIGDESTLNTMKCVVNTAPDLTADYYETILQLSQKGMQGVIGGTEQEFSALKDFMLASMNSINDCVSQHMPGAGPLASPEDLTQQLDSMRDYFAGPQ
tara:strand:- start:589 stop:1128 length:540 start_codon:yes stop_codon:yes gene_type:complete